MSVEETIKEAFSVEDSRTVESVSTNRGQVTVTLNEEITVEEAEELVEEIGESHPSRTFATSVSQQLDNEEENIRYKVQFRMRE